MEAIPDENKHTCHTMRIKVKFTNISQSIGIPVKIVSCNSDNCETLLHYTPLANEDVLETVYLETMNNNDVYKKRRCIVEHPFGTIKRTLGYNYFLRRQKENVDAEAASMFIAYNIKRLLSMFKTQELVMKFI